MIKGFRGLKELKDFRGFQDIREIQAVGIVMCNLQALLVKASIE